MTYICNSNFLLAIRILKCKTWNNTKYYFNSLVIIYLILFVVLTLQNQILTCTIWNGACPMPIFDSGTWLVTIHVNAQTVAWLVTIDSTEIHASFLNSLVTGTVVTTYYFFYIYVWVTVLRTPNYVSRLFKKKKTPKSVSPHPLGRIIL